MLTICVSVNIFSTLCCFLLIIFHVLIFSWLINAFAFVLLEQYPLSGCVKIDRLCMKLLYPSDNFGSLHVRYHRGEAWGGGGGGKGGGAERGPGMRLVWV